MHQHCHHLSSWLIRFHHHTKYTHIYHHWPCVGMEIANNPSKATREATWSTHSECLNSPSWTTSASSSSSSVQSCRGRDQPEPVRDQKSAQLSVKFWEWLLKIKSTRFMLTRGFVLVAPRSLVMYMANITAAKWEYVDDATSCVKWNQASDIT